jgi:very-short-patch-repair endonuclease
VHVSTIPTSREINFFPQYDLERDQALNERGLRVIRIQNREVFENLDAVLQTIHQACMK